MAHDVFISHATSASRDKSIADGVCATLEREGIRCWIAPRDILPSADWGASVMQAVRGSKAIVLVLSGAANSSPYILREVERAVHLGIPILPLRIEDVLPEGALEFHLGTVHWLDAMTPPLEAHLERLADTLLTILGREPRQAQPAHRPDAESPILTEPEARRAAASPKTAKTPPATPPLKKIATVERVDIAGEGIPVRDHRTLFDRSKYGTNWWLVGAFVAATLIAALVKGMLEGITYGSMLFPSADFYLFSLPVAAAMGAAQVVLLHRQLTPRQLALTYGLCGVVLGFLERLVLNARGATHRMEYAGSKFLDSGYQAPSGDGGITLGAIEAVYFSLPVYLFLQFALAALVMAGLVTALKYRGPTVTALALGFASAWLVHEVMTMILAVIHGVPMGAQTGRWRSVVTIATSAAIFGALYWRAIDAHLRRRGVKLAGGAVAIADRRAAAGSALPAA
jgi:hypothetical protein